MDWGHALEMCDEILELCDDLPDAADDFAISVSEKAWRIAAWIEEHETVTEKQEAALDNMLLGCQKWLDR